MGTGGALGSFIGTTTVVGELGCVCIYIAFAEEVLVAQYGGDLEAKGFAVKVCVKVCVKVYAKTFYLTVLMIATTVSSMIVGNVSTLAMACVISFARKKNSVKLRLSCHIERTMNTPRIEQLKSITGRCAIAPQRTQRLVRRGFRHGVPRFCTTASGGRAEQFVSHSHVRTRVRSECATTVHEGTRGCPSSCTPHIGRACLPTRVAVTSIRHSTRRGVQCAHAFLGFLLGFLGFLGFAFVALHDNALADEAIKIRGLAGVTIAPVGRD